MVKKTMKGYGKACLATGISFLFALTLATPAFASSYTADDNPSETGVATIMAAQDMNMQTFENAQAFYAWAIAQQKTSLQTAILQQFANSASADSVTDDTWAKANAWGPVFLVTTGDNAVSDTTEYGLITVELGGKTYGIEVGQLANNTLYYFTLGDNGQQVDLIDGQDKSSAAQELAGLATAVEGLVSDGGTVNIGVYASEKEINSSSYNEVVTQGEPVVEQTGVQVEAATVAEPTAEFTVYENVEAYYNAKKDNASLAAEIVKKFLGEVQEPYDWTTANTYGPLFSAVLTPPAGTASSNQVGVFTINVGGVDYTFTTGGPVGKGGDWFFTFGDGGKNIEFIDNAANPGGNAETFDNIVKDWETNGFSNLPVEVRFADEVNAGTIQSVLAEEPSATEQVSLPASVPTPSDKASLKAAIDAATAASEATEVSYNGRNIEANDMWATPAAFLALKEATEAANAVYNNAGATPDQIAAAIESMEKATKTFNDSRKNGQPLVTYAIPVYEDVEGNWAWKDGLIQDIAEKGLMAGWKNEYGQYFFGPTDNITRGQVACILYRYAEGDTVNPIAQSAEYPNNTTPFKDNIDGQYYTEAMNWAYNAGVFTGYSGTDLVGPNDFITREQLATVLYRYSVETLGVPSTGNEASTLNGVNGADTVSEWATAPVAWCYYNKVMTGYEPDKWLGAHDTANRAQAAKMISIVLGDIIGW